MDAQATRTLTELSARVMEMANPPSPGGGSVACTGRAIRPVVVVVSGDGVLSGGAVQRQRSRLLADGSGGDRTHRPAREEPPLLHAGWQAVL